MDEIRQYISERKHKQIIESGVPNIDFIKAIAFIFLKEYEQALSLLQITDYEYSYCLYKMKSFKKALRCIARLKDSIKVRILKAQCMYQLGRYNKAFTLFQDNSKLESSIVNQFACIGLARLGVNGSNNKPFVYSIPISEFCHINLYPEHPFSLDKKEECEYNLCFQNLYDENVFFEKLDISNPYCSRLVECIKNEPLTCSSNLEKAVLEFNTHGTPIKQPTHFQRIESSEYANIRNLKSGIQKYRSISSKTHNLLLFKSLNEIRQSKLISPMKMAEYNDHALFRTILILRSLQEEHPITDVINII